MVPQKKMGRQTIKLKNDVKIIGSATIGGKKESEGPIGKFLDQVIPDEKWGEKTFEKGESKIQNKTVLKAIENANKTQNDIDLIFVGDLLNQCIGSHYAIRDMEIPFYGLYGACSTMAEALSLGAMAIDGEFSENVVCGTSSNFYSAERQFRSPIEYGGQRPPTSQWTVTGSGAAVLSNEGEGPYITHITTGKIVDKGVTDINNMGAAMAPAAVDTLLVHFDDTGTVASDYDLILTGDLGSLGKEITVDLMKKNGIELGSNYDDCGLLIYDLKKQEVECGGSGCGCSAIVFCSYILSEMKKGHLNKVLFLGTGALMNPTILQQGESIPSIAHAVVISNTKQ